MQKGNRRTVLAGAAAGMGGLAAGLSLSGIGSSAFAESATPDNSGKPAPPAKVDPEDSRYRHLVSRVDNTRFMPQPEYFHLVNSTEQVVEAVNQATAAGKRITVRSGGHCFDNLVDNDDVIIDMSGMGRVYFDSTHRAFAIEPGQELGDVYRKLFLGWGVTIPAGGCPEVGVGGHILGGGYGPMSRQFGLTVDHLYGVEVVTVDAEGAARVTVATREDNDPHRDLWWAHTGCGGGNFGIVTRYLMRSPEAESEDPAQLLPRPPSEVLTFGLVWDWEDLDEESFHRLTNQYGRWYQDNSAPDSPGNSVYSVLMLNGRVAQSVMLAGEVAGDNPEEQFEEFLAAVTEGMSSPPLRVEEQVPWLTQRLAAWADENQPPRSKFKNGYLKQGLSDHQIAVLWEYLSQNDTVQPIGGVWLVGYGGHANSVDPTDTAVFQRSSVLKTIYIATWEESDADEECLGWVRSLYSDVYSETNGVPEFDDRNDGCFINYADVDLTDPELNLSDTPWHELYYGDNYPRLQEIKATWDPTNVFHHDLSVRAAK